MNKPQELRSFRLVCPQSRQNQVEKLLTEQGFLFEPVPFSPLVRKLVHEPFPLGASLAAKFGYIYIQDASSMLPPLVLQPKDGMRVLDMCASPGSKTGLLAQLVGNSGFVLGNEPSQNRHATLRHNIIDMNLLQVGTSKYSAERFPLPSTENGLAGHWDFILLDPPCSGWGTVEKNPQVMQLWQGEKVKPLVALQRSLLERATALLRTGGQMVYSTCTTNAQENDEQVRFAVEELGMVVVPLAPPPGFVVTGGAVPGTLNLPVTEQQQGFFVALLQKTEKTVQLQEHRWGAAQRTKEMARIDGGGKRERMGRPKRQADTPSLWLAPAVLEEAGYAPELLPAGKLQVVQQQLFFLPQAALDFLEADIVWKGFLLGKEHNGRVRFSPSLRGLTPEYSEMSAGTALQLDDLAPLEKLLAGQSLACTTQSKFMHVYYRNLPMCRLQVKQGRLMFAAQ